MKLNFGPRNVIQLDHARICFRNFEGRKDQYNPGGKRSFAVVIDDEEIKDALVNDTNRFGVGWNVKIRPPREEGEDAFMYMNVNVKFNDRGPDVYLVSGDAEPVKLSEEAVRCIDQMDISHCDMDIRPYDGEMRGEAFRSAYLQEIWVYQNVSRFASRLSPRDGEGTLPF